MLLLTCEEIPPPSGNGLACLSVLKTKRCSGFLQGFAHGFYVISQQADFFYKCTDFYAPEYERAIRWDDPDLAIDWPLIDDKAPVVAPKDANAAAFKRCRIL